MFAKRFTAPFGLLGDEAKLAFPTQPGGIQKLATVRNIPDTDSYWEQYFVLFDSASDVFSLITPHHIRRALSDAPENVATLIQVVSARLFSLISDHTFPSPANASVAAFASSLIKTGVSSERSTTKEVLNCVRILERVLPVVFEVDGESNAFDLEVLWKKIEVEEEEARDPAAETRDTPQFVIEDDDDSEEAERPEPAPKATKQKQRLPSLAEKLFSAIIDLLFCCGFTIPMSVQVDHYKINYVIWEKGVGSTVDPGPSNSYDSNKTEVLRLLLVLLSRQIYVPPGSLFSKPSLYSLHIVQKIPRRDVLTILCSLLNTAMNSSSPHDNTIGSMAGKLPYNHLVFKGEDSRITLISTCLQVLNALLDFQSGSARDAVTGTGDNQSSSPTAHTNTFRYFLAKLHRSQDFEFIVDGITGILEQQSATVNKLLPGARKSIPYTNDTIIFFWKIIELNKKFRQYVLQSEKSMDLVGYLLCHAIEIKDKPQQHGICRALSYIIQTLSAEPAFGAKLSKPVKAQLPAKWNAAGTAADFIINAVYAMVATTSGQLNSLYPALVIALANLAPHFKDLTVVASTRLVQLFTSFSNPLFLLADEGHPRLLFFMLEIFNSVILNHLTQNPNLIYGILSSHRTFEELGTFTLSRGLREIERARRTKEEQAKKAETNPKGKNRDIEDPDPGAEKARLLEREGIATVFDAGDSQPGSPRGSEDDGSGPAVPHVVEGSTSTPVSEKARGKMRERHSLSLEMNDSLERLSVAGVGRNGFVPTQEWVTSWQQGLPLDTVMLLISELLPKIQELQATRHRANSTSIIVEFLSTVSLKHVFPEAAPAPPRRFMWSDASIVWLTSLIWGEIYVRGMTPLGIWNSTNVRLFYVKHSVNQPRQITETVSTVVGGLLGRTNSDSAARTRS